MDKNNIYIKWKEYRKEVHLSDNFSSQVMEKIHGYKRNRNVKLFEFLLLELNSLPRWLLRFALTFGLLAINYQWAY